MELTYISNNGGYLLLVLMGVMSCKKVSTALKIVRVYDDLTIGSTYLENSIEAWCK